MSEEGERGEAAGLWAVVRALSWSRLALALRKTRASRWVRVMELRMARLASVEALEGWAVSCSAAIPRRTLRRLERVSTVAVAAVESGEISSMRRWTAPPERTWAAAV